MFHPLVPCHLGDMDQAFNAGFEFNEGAIIGETDDFTLNSHIFRIAHIGVKPRILRQLLVAQRDSSVFFAELNYLHLDLVSNIEKLGGMVYPAPGHIRNV